MNVWTYWKCSSCGSIIRGDSRECPNCGTPIPSGVKYLMPDNPEVVSAIQNGTVLIKGEKHVDEKGIVAEVVSKEQESDKPNWNCVYCGFQNRFEDTTCQGCGAGKEESDSDYFGNKPVMDKHNQDDYERRTGTRYEPPDEPPMPPKPVLTPNYTPEPERPSGRILELLGAYWKKGAIAAGVIFLIAFLFWLLMPITRTATVTGFEWERSIAVEEYTLCHEDDWSLPQGAELTSQRQEIRHYDKVLDHYETKTRQVAEQVFDGYDTSYRDLGNGQAEVVQTPRYRTEYRTETYEEPVYRQEPVYRTKYYYDIGRWKEVSAIFTSSADQSPYWGETSLPTSVPNPDYGDRKQGSRHESYYAVILSEQGNIRNVEYGFTEWSELSVGDTIFYKSWRFSDRQWIVA